MKIVAKKEFYKSIKEKDITVHVKGDYPFATEFKMRHGGVVGKCDLNGVYWLKKA